MNRERYRPPQFRWLLSRVATRASSRHHWAIGARCASTALLLSCSIVGCRTKTAFRKPDLDLNRMLEVPRYDIYEESAFFEDKMTMRRPPEGTVPRSAETGDPAYLRGMKAGAFLGTFPIELTENLIERGRGRFERTCSACHGMSGRGNAMVTRFMQRPAPSLHEPRIRELPPGKVFFIISNGYGFMPDYATHLSVQDRWAVVAYVKVLERSQYAPIASLPDALRRELARRLPQ